MTTTRAPTIGAFTYPALSTLFPIRPCRTSKLPADMTVASRRAIVARLLSSTAKDHKPTSVNGDGSGE